MIIATIPHNGEKLTVEVLDVFTSPNGVKMARVRALAGQPFKAWTPGGCHASDSTRFPAGLLRDMTLANPNNQTSN